MATTLNIDPNGIYDDGTLVLALDLTHATLTRERRVGNLRFARKGKRVLYLGRWILDWLEQMDETAEATAPEELETVITSK